MKVFTTEAALLGKKRYTDKRVEALSQKFLPKKVTYASVEFTDANKEGADCLAIYPQQKVDFIVEDIEKIENLGQPALQNISAEALAGLEKEQFLSEFLSQEKLEQFKPYNLITAKPLVMLTQELKDNINELLQLVFLRSGYVFFFTAGEKEVRAWMVKKGANIVDCAGKIHTDLARGFIRADIYNVSDLDKFHNLNEARQRGLMKTVGKEYIINPGDVVDIKFSV